MSCCAVDVLPQPSSGGGGTLTYNPITKELSISGGNTVVINENQALAFDTNTNQLAITNGLSGIVNIVDLNPVYFQIAYWDMYIHYGKRIELSINKDYNVRTGNQADGYLLFPNVFSGKYNTLIDGDYFNGDYVSIFLGSLKTTQSVNFHANKHQTGVDVVLAPVSCLIKGSAVDTTLLIDRTNYYNDDIGINITAPGTFAIVGAVIDPAMVTISNVFVQYSLGFIAGSLSFYIELYDTTNSIVVGTSATITTTTTAADYEEFWFNEPLSISTSILPNSIVEVRLVVTTITANLFRFGIFFMFEQYN